MKKNISITLCLALILLVGCTRKDSGTVQAAENAPPSERAAPPPQPITLPAGTAFHVRLQETLDTQRNRTGDRFTAVLDEPLVSDDRVVVPKGSIFLGHITRSSPSGRFKGRAFIGMKLDSFVLEGRTYEIGSTGFSRASAGHKKHHLTWIGGGSGGGAAIGAIAGGGAGALIGAGAGAAAGTIGSAITGKRNVRLPVESRIRFMLQKPVTLD